MDNKNYSQKLLLPQINYKSKQTNINCENIYKKAYQTYLFKIMHDTTNHLGKNMFPIKLERSINIVK